MADDKSKSGAGDNPDPPEEDDDSGEKRWDRETLESKSRALFNVKGPEMAGALASAPANRKTFGEDEVKDLLKKFKNRKIKPDEGTPQAEEEE